MTKTNRQIKKKKRGISQSELVLIKIMLIVIKIIPYILHVVQNPVSKFTRESSI